MERQESEVLLARIERLERRTSVVMAGWVLSVATFVLLGVAVQQAVSQPEVLRARRIEVVDTAGRARIAVGITPDGGPGLFLLDAAGRPRMALGVAPDGSPEFVLRDAAGQIRITLSVSPDGTGFIFRDAADRARIILGVLPDAPPGFLLLDAAGRVLFRAP